MDPTIDYLATADMWARRALALAESITTGEEEERCDLGCLEAMFVLAELPWMAINWRNWRERMKAEDGALDEQDQNRDGSRDGAVNGEWGGEAEAIKWFEEALKLSAKIGSQTGVLRAKSGLECLGSKSPILDDVKIIAWDEDGGRNKEDPL